jgi:hypothetical protein
VTVSFWGKKNSGKLKKGGSVSVKLGREEVD